MTPTAMQYLNPADAALEHAETLTDILDILVRLEQRLSDIEQVDPIANLIARVAALEARLDRIERQGRIRFAVQLHTNTSPPVDYRDRAVAERSASMALEGVKKWQQRLDAVERQLANDQQRYGDTIVEFEDTGNKMRAAWSIMAKRIEALEKRGS
jgi:hypothetical protein